MDNVPVLLRVLFGGLTVIVATTSLASAQTRQPGKDAVTPPSAVAAPAAPQPAPAEAVQRRTDGHTINLTVDTNPAGTPAGTPKLGSPALMSGAAGINGLPPATDAGSFEARPAPATTPAPGYRLPQPR
jgi:hypothetical protein